MSLPSIETVEYGRRVIGEVRDLMRKFERDSLHTAQGERWRMVANVLDRYLLGFGKGSCTITPFDERYLDPAFRATWEQLDAEIASRADEDES